jgi:hypothetical protein
MLNNEVAHRFPFSRRKRIASERADGTQAFESASDARSDHK